SIFPATRFFQATGIKACERGDERSKTLDGCGFNRLDAPIPCGLTGICELISEMVREFQGGSASPEKHQPLVSTSQRKHFFTAMMSENTRTMRLSAGGVAS
ncbi:MAG: hypothetical protein ACE5JX_10415, partial [Acidobacteriota bacterium]